MKAVTMRKFMLLSLCVALLAISCPGGDPDDTEPFRDISAMDLVKDMKLGVNIGNTFDSIGGETAWGNPKVSQAYIKSLKSHGFKSVRLPVTWAENIGSAPNYTVTSTWMARVEEVVEWILEEDMYCILNVHHDGADIANKSWIEEMIDKDKKEVIPAKEAEVKDKYTKLWNQIAVRFKAKSDKLIFEGLNEPQFDKLWNRYGSGQATEKATAFRLLNELNQIFVNTVRKTEGNNSIRFLLISSYWTDIDVTVQNWGGNFFKMPTDTATDKLILSFHYYTPWNFCGGDSTTWGTTSDINTLNNQFKKVSDNILSKNIPVILGEYGVDIGSGAKVRNSENRIAWLLGVTQKCVDLGICPVLWDTGMRNNNKGMADIERASPFGITDDLKSVLESVNLPK